MTTAKSGDEVRRDILSRIVGQDEAVDAIVDMYSVAAAGLTPPGRVPGSMILLGPTGVGKTELVRALATVLHGDSDKMIRIDCGEYTSSHEIAKLIGSPPGYLGHRETHPLLSQEVLNQFHTEKIRVSFVLFDEIEKASDALWNLLLGILDKATLTLGDNRRVDFSRAMVFLTSNLGASEMGALLNPKLGFGAAPPAADGIRDSRTEARIERSGVEAARRKFTPEFMNRIDKVVTFRPLGSAELEQVLDIELRLVQERVMAAGPERRFVFTVGQEARQHLLREGTDVRYGARHLKRAIERHLVQPMSNLIASDQVRSGDLLRVGFDETRNVLTFAREAQGLPLAEMAAIAGGLPLEIAQPAAAALPEPVRIPAARMPRRN